MSDHLEDEKQVEMIKAWWHENGNFLLLGIAIILGSHFGWQKWQQHKHHLAKLASDQYQQVLAGSDAGQLSAIGHSGYATLLAFQEAKKAVEANHLNQAKEKLIWVVNHGDNPALRQLARIRASRILLAQNHLEHAKNMLKKEESKTFLPMINQVKGEIALAEHQPGKAKVFFQQAYDAWSEDSPARVYLQMQLSELK